MACRIAALILGFSFVVSTSGTALADPADALIVEFTTMAEADGLPARPLVDKIREGRAKGIPPPRIRAALMSLRGRLLEARELCGPQADLACIQAGADALANKIKRRALRELLEGAQGSTAPSRTRIFVALTRLRASGLEPAASVSEVAAALEQGDLDRLLPPVEPMGGTWAPPAVGRGGELPVQNPTRDRDQTGRGKAWGRGKEKPGRPAMPGRPDAPGRPDSPGNSGDAPGQQ